VSLTPIKKIQTLENFYKLVCYARAKCGIKAWGLRQGKNCIKFTADIARM